MNLELKGNVASLLELTRCVPTSSNVPQAKPYLLKDGNSVAVVAEKPALGTNRQLGGLTARA